MAKNKTFIWIIVGVLIGAVLAYLIFSSMSNSNSQPPATKCSQGYFWTGSNCCLDQDNNAVCDSEQSVFKYTLDCNGIGDMTPCVNQCISKCSEQGLRIAVSARDGNDLASFPGSDGKFYCNCVKN